jgi:hypothetical protein
LLFFKECKYISPIEDAEASIYPFIEWLRMFFTHAKEVIAPIWDLIVEKTYL